MPVSPCDHHSTAATVTVTEEPDHSDIDNTSDNSTSLSDVHGPRFLSHSAVKFGTVEVVEGQNALQNFRTSNESRFKRYHWKMTHYFYIHLIFFIFNGLVGGLIIWLIENHSSSRNTDMTVPYLDAWFTTVSCICSCGLTTIDFAQLSRASQIVLMGFGFLSCFAISTLPALIIKTYTHKSIEGTNADDDNDEHDSNNNDESEMSDLRRHQNLPPHIRAELALLPTPTTLRYRVYITCIVLILSTYCTIFTIGFLAIGAWLQTHNSPEYLIQNNVTLSPWYVSFMLTLYSFNQNGLTPFSTSLAAST